MSACTRCKATPETGLPAPGMSRFSASVTRITYKIKFNYIRMREWRDAPTARDVIQSAFNTETVLCGRCWGDVLNFICTTKPEVLA
jgi:hypothetical protein